jgi:hypothetical protein
MRNRKLSRRELLMTSTALAAGAMVMRPFDAFAQPGVAQGALIARAKSLELDTPYVPPPGDALEHHASGFAKIICSAVFVTGLNPDFAAENVGYFTAPYEVRHKLGKPVIDRAEKAVHVTLPNRAPEVAQDTPSPLLDLARPEDAAKVQRRLIELGYLSSTADGRWGPLSRQALQQFRNASKLGRDDAWDESTQRRLFSSDAIRLPRTYVGTWTDDSSQCVNGRGFVSISARRAEANGTACDFDSVQQETESSWSIRARCVSPTARWIANIKLSLSNPRLIWTSEKGTDHFYRCSG